MEGSLEISSLADQLSPHQLNLVVLWINRTADHFLVPNIDSKLLTNPVIKSQAKGLESQSQLTDAERLDYLHAGVEFLSRIFSGDELVKNDQTAMTVLKYLAGVHTIKYNEGKSAAYLLDVLFDKIPEKYFRFLMMLKPTTSLTNEFHDQLHQDLLTRLQAPQGFAILCKILLLRSALQEPEESKQKKVAALVGIVSRAGHSEAFYTSMIAQIQQLIRSCLKNAEEAELLSVGIACLNKIQKLSKVKQEDRAQIEEFIFAELRLLAAPEDIITGIIIFEHKELLAVFHLLRISFIGPPGSTFPSKMLIPYLPLLLQLQNKLPRSATQLQQTITNLVVRCLVNRQSTELGDIVDSILLEEYSPDDLQLHPRIIFKISPDDRITCQIGDQTQCVFYNPSDLLVSLLKASNNNILVYNIFLHLLEQLDQCLVETTDRSDLVADMDEMTQLVSTVFKRRIAVIGTLSELIGHKPFHSQFNENPGATIDCLTNVLRKQITAIRSQPIASQEASSNPIAVIVLSIIREFLEKLKHRDNFRHFLAALKEYRSVATDQDILNHIDGILQLIDEQPPSQTPAEESAFEAARILCSASEPHLKVYGLVQFKKLIVAGNNPEVLAKRHAILAIAMDALRDADSYVFLNCIRLLVSLVDLLEAEVLEAMVAEYRTEDADTDFRLKVGEVIVKVTEQLGK